MFLKVVGLIKYLEENPCNDILFNKFELYVNK